MNERLNYSKMLTRKAGLEDQRGSSFTSEVNGHIHAFQVVMDKEGNIAPDFDAITGFEHGITDYVDRHYHLVMADGTTGPANEQPGGHTHTYENPISGEGLFGHGNG